MLQAVRLLLFRRPAAELTVGRNMAFLLRGNALLNDLRKAAQ